MADIQDQSDAYNVVQLEYLDRRNQYNMAIALASDAANVAQYGMRQKDPVTVHCVCTPAVAAIAAQLWLQRTLYVRTQYKFKLGWMFALLEPGDMLELTDAGLGLAAYTVRITQIDEDEKDGTLDVTCEDLLVGVSNTPLYTMQNAAPTVTSQTVDPGGVEANLLKFSQDWTNAAWVRSSVNPVTAGAATNPITGATDAQKIVPNTSNSTHFIEQQIAPFPAANYTFSLYVQAAGYSFVDLQIRDFTSVSVAAVQFNLNTGAVTITSASGSSPPVIVSTSIVSVGGGWYRVSMTASGFAGATTFVAIRVDNNAGSGSYVGDGTSGLYLYGAQLTQGVDVRPYAGTTSAARRRRSSTRRWR